MDTTDFYTILGVDRDADTATIRQAFKKLALIYHPDKVPESERTQAEVHFKMLSEAYDVLGNEESRMIYDSEAQFGGAHSQDWQEFYAGPQDFGFDFDFEYGNPFGGTQFGGTQFGKSRTEDVIYETEFTLEEVYSGKVVKLSTQRQVICRKCKGTGGRPKAAKRKCHGCNGTGTTRKSHMVAPNLYSTETVACPVCAGQGRVFSNKDLCKRCEGRQVQPLKSIIEVYVPKGVKNNHRIVVPQQADEEVGKETGDLIILVRIMPHHQTFRRLGLDLYASCEISLRESLAGFQKRVVTHLDGRELVVKVSKGQITGPNSVLKIANEGLILQQDDGSETVGDLYLQVQVTFPTTLPDDKIDELVAFLDEDDNSRDETHGIEVKHETLMESDLPEYEADANDEPEISKKEEYVKPQPQSSGCVIM